MKTRAAEYFEKVLENIPYKQKVNNLEKTYNRN
jgi:hypothetical protein